MIGFWKKIKPGLLPALLLAFSLAVYWRHYQPALGGWFNREDSRFFANGLFSFYDLLTAFLTPANSMGQYRPITKLLWGMPQWLFGFEAAYFHWISFSLLALAALCLMRLHYLFFQHQLFAIFAGILFALMPVNAKPVYWISAWHNLGSLLFLLAAFCFRLEQWRQPKREQLFRGLCLASFFLALASREVAFLAGCLLFLIDYREGKLKKSWDFFLLLATVSIFVFVYDPPFNKTHAQPDFWRAFSPSVIFPVLWDYAKSVPWSRNDHMEWSYFYLRPILSALFLLLAFIGLFFSRLRFASLLCWTGIAPFLLLQIFSTEYPNLMAAGLCLLLTGIGAMAAEKFRVANIFVFLFAIACSGGYALYLDESRSYFKRNYADRGNEMRGFIEELAAFSDSLPPYRRLEIVDFGSYKNAGAKDSHHFLEPGLDQIYPKRVFLFTKESLGIPDGTGLKNPEHPFWSYLYPDLDPPIRARYTDKGFEVIQ
jgi:hypothetical protein